MKKHKQSKISEIQASLDKVLASMLPEMIHRMIQEIQFTERFLKAMKKKGKGRPIKVVTNERA